MDRPTDLLLVRAVGSDLRLIRHGENAVGRQSARRLNGDRATSVPVPVSVTQESRRVNLCSAVVLITCHNTGGPRVEWLTNDALIVRGQKWIPAHSDKVNVKLTMT